MIKRILVCGCARSGNTVMLHLLDTGFEDTEILYHGSGGEVAPTKEHLVEGKIVIGKFPKKASKLSRWLSEEDLGVVYMMRDPRDVLVSRHPLKPKKYWVQPTRWIETAEIANQYKDHERVMILKYENLMTHPEDTQRKIAVRFGLKISQPFSECYRNFDKEDTINMSTMNGARPLDPSRIGNWADDPKKKLHIEKVMKSHPSIAKWMKEFGYQSKS